MTAADPASAVLRRPRWSVRLHWATLALLVLGVAAVLVRELVEARAARLWLLELHRGCGLLVLAAGLLRLLQRWRHRPWPPAAAGPRALHLLAGGTHALLYALLLAVPLAGWALSSAAELPAAGQGLPLPALLAADEDLADVLHRWHGGAAVAMGVLVGLHAAAALWHHLVRRDGVLRAMWPPWPR